MSSTMNSRDYHQSPSIADLTTKDLLVVIFSYLDMRTVSVLSRVSNNWRKSDSDLWPAMAHRRFGESMAEFSVTLYEDNYKAMMVDDNRLVALPTLFDRPPCFAPNNKNNCCKILCVQWRRLEGTVRIYYDAIGDEHNMRKSRLALIKGPTFLNELWDQLRKRTIVYSRPKHYHRITCQVDFAARYHAHERGYVDFEADNFSHRGAYYYIHDTEHYVSQRWGEWLLKVSSEGLSVFDFHANDGDDKPYFTRDEPPSDPVSDTRKSDKERKIRWYYEGLPLEFSDDLSLGDDWSSGVDRSLGDD